MIAMDGAAYRRMLLSAAASIERNKEAINELNQSYLFARWYAMDNNTVNVEADCNFRNGEGNGEALVETLSLLLRVMEEGYPSLMEYEL